MDFNDFIKYNSFKKTFKTKKRVAGLAHGLISLKDNFDDPIEGFKNYNVTIVWDK